MVGRLGSLARKVIGEAVEAALKLEVGHRRGIGPDHVQGLRQWNVRGVSIAGGRCVGELHIDLRGLNSVDREIGWRELETYVGEASAREGAESDLHHGCRG